MVRRKRAGRIVREARRVAPQAARMMDANLNRASEALRVLEDGARFSDPPQASTAALLKQWRHFLRGIVKRYGGVNLEFLAARQAAQDPGRAGGIRSGYQSFEDLKAANWRRLFEALRSLEETARGFSLPAAREFSRLRFAAYEVEKRSRLADRRAQSLNSVRLYLVATPRPGWSPERFVRVVSEAVQGGTEMVQLRVKEGSDRAVVRLARRLRRATRRLGALFIVNDRADLAVLVEADGVHVGQQDMTVADARRLVGEGRLVGVSTHSVRQALAAARAGADYVGFGPIYPTPTKPGRRAIGLADLPAVARRLTIPFFVIGGISTGTLAPVRRAGARRVSVSSAILDAADPRRAARQILQGLKT